jgi:cephalosporin hydroxylase
MRITIDTKLRTLNGEPLYTKASFELLSDLWLQVGWQLKYPYTFSWMGLPILQIPEDMIRMQEVVWRLKPDVIVETGVAHGGSLVYYAALCKVIGHGRVIGIEKGLRCRPAISAHPLEPYITLIEGDSVDPMVVDAVRMMCEGHKTLVILDSDHSRAHVAKELAAYAPLIQPGFYIVACDGNMQDLAEVPRGKRQWRWDNPQEAAREFAATHPEFAIEDPAWPFNESELTRAVTYWPSAWLRRLEIPDAKSDRL